MSAASRIKGRAGEQEVARILRDWLGEGIHRNWQAQTAVGGQDIVGVDGWAIEVKRAKADNRSAWWAQTVTQADKAGCKPCLIFRIDGHGRGLDPADKWQVVVRLQDIGVDAEGNAVVTMRSWMDIVREGLNG